MTKPTPTTPWRYLTPLLLALILAVTLLSGCGDISLPTPTSPQPAPEEPTEPAPQPEPGEPGQPEEPEPQPDPQPENPEDPTPETPEPDPTPETPDPKPEPENPQPNPEPEPDPEPQPEPEPEPENPEPETPDPEPEPEPEPKPEPEEPAPDPAPQPPTLRLMPMGDSVTYGDFSSEGNGYRVELAEALVQGENAAAEVTFVGSQSSAEQGAAPGYNHEGYRGWVIQQLSDLMSPNAPPQSPLLRYKPNLITLHAGTNDMKQDRNVAQAPQRLNTLIDTIFETLPDVTLVVATLVPAQDEAVNARINAYNQEIRKLVKAERAQGRQIVLADMSAVTRADLADNVHPNDGGYEKMARAFDQATKKASQSGWFAD